MGFDFSTLKLLINLHNDLKYKLSTFLDDYKLTPKMILFVCVTFKQLDHKLLSEFRIDRPSHMSIREFAPISTSLSIPISINPNSIGKPLPVKF